MVTSISSTRSTMEFGPPSAGSSPQKTSSPAMQTSQSQQNGLPSISTVTPLSSPPKTVPDVAGYHRESISRATQQLQDSATSSNSRSENLFFPRIRTTTQSPHIQQQSSYLRHQPMVMSPQTMSSRGSLVLPSPPGRRRAIPEGFSPAATIVSSGSSSSSSAPITPLIAGFDEASRIHRALPIPSASPGYFALERSHHHRHQRQPSQSESPHITFGQQPPAFQSPIDHHSRSYPASGSPQHSGCLPQQPGAALPPPPPLQRPASRHHPD